MRPPDGLTPGQRLAAKAAEAAEVRTWQTHPDVVALRVERTRTLVDRLIWGGIIVGLLFTASNVQAFVADTTNAVFGSLGWWAAWLVDPTIAAVLLGILIAERRVAPGQIKLDRIARVAKWVLLGMTYGANTWQAWADRSPAGIMLHSFPPLVVFLAAEVVPGLHDKLTGFVYWARDEADKRTESAAPMISDPGPSEPVSGGFGQPGSEHHSTQTWSAPLGHSGVPARLVETVPPAHGGLDLPVSPSGVGSIKVSQPKRDTAATNEPPLARQTYDTDATNLRHERDDECDTAATTQPPRRDKPRDKPATRARQTASATAEQRRAWVRQQRDNGRSVTGADVHKQFPHAPRDGARVVRQVEAELEAELRAVAAGAR